MIRITWHHTGGGYSPSNDDKRAYHFLIDGDGNQHRGTFPVEANRKGKVLESGKYAAHTKNLNSGNIGIGVCGMANANWKEPFKSNRFIRPVQMESLARLSAELGRIWSIPIDRRHMLSHAEVEPTLSVAQNGKWDFDYDPWGEDLSRDPIFIGDKIRAEVTMAMRADGVPIEPKSNPTIRQGDTGELVYLVQRALNVSADGIFGPKTRAAVIKFQRSKQLLPDGIVGPATWAHILKVK